MNRPQPASADNSAFLAYLDVRRRTAELAASLCVEDQVIQSMPDASPTKWHLAHTTWFFERFILADHAPGYAPVNEHYFYLFNSYYNSLGPMHKRLHRGLLSRPTVAEISDYRATIDERMLDWLDRTKLTDAQQFLLTLGINHEQQHQELILTDIKHALAQNPMLPAYTQLAVPESANSPMNFVSIAERDCANGHEGDHFAFDNETPRHKVLVHAHELADRLVNNGEYLEFVKDGGYDTAELWLSEAWSTLQERGWKHPIYWQPDLASEYTLSGVRELDLNAPVCHLSLYEADAFARWAGARLPTETELECIAADQEVEGNFYESGALHPVAPGASDGSVRQVFGDVWEWTGTSYGPYPGFKTLAGSLGEYNGKFMCSQHVLRGGSCVSPQSHLRATYRNFFYPDSRWQFSGVRLAKDL
ncbi:MAG: ergothioneine biosynthesis protein EgtB [Gammaproteobacteria bacterium]